MDKPMDCGILYCSMTFDGVEIPVPAAHFVQRKGHCWIKYIGSHVELTDKPATLLIRLHTAQDKCPANALYKVVRHNLKVVSEKNYFDRNSPPAYWEVTFD